MTNEQAARAFAAQFTPPLNVSGTMQINNVKVRDGWVAAGEMLGRDMIVVGVTATVHGNGTFHAFAEIMGGANTAADAGKLLAGLMQDE